MKLKLEHPLTAVIVFVVGMIVIVPLGLWLVEP